MPKPEVNVTLSFQLSAKVSITDKAVSIIWYADEQEIKSEIFPYKDNWTREVAESNLNKGNMKESFIKIFQGVI